MIETIVIFVIGCFIGREFFIPMAFGCLVGLFIVTALLERIDPFDRFRIIFRQLTKTQFYRLFVACAYAIIIPVHAFRGYLNSFPPILLKNRYGGYFIWPPHVDRPYFFETAGMVVILFGVCTFIYEDIDKRIFAKISQLLRSKISKLKK